MSSFSHTQETALSFCGWGEANLSDPHMRFCGCRLPCL